MSNHEQGILKCTIDYDAKVPGVTLHQFIIEKLTQHPTDGIAMVKFPENSHLTFMETFKATLALSATLQADFGLLKGQVVALALPNCAEFFVSFLAISRCGGASTLINPSSTILELENMVKITRPTLWICTPDVLMQLNKISSGGRPHRAIIVDSDSTAFNMKTTYDFQVLSWSSAITSSIEKHEKFTEPSFDVQEDVVTIPFSSGTTGMPKGVMITHQNFMTAIYSFLEGWCPMLENDVIIGLLPFYHVYGCLMGAASLILGVRSINFTKFSFIGMLQAIQEHKVTVIPLVPPIMTMFSKLAVVDDYDLSSVKVVICGAAPLSSKVLENVVGKFGWDFIQIYGVTECTFATHTTPRGENKLLGKTGSIGVLMPFIEAKIVDQETFKITLVGARKVGELCLRSPMVMKGYQGNPSATAGVIDSDGWLHTGDLAYYDEDGWFFIVGRFKELIKFKGIQVAPSELEHIILQHPDVVDAAVVGIPDEIAGELPKAYVVKKTGSSITEEELANYLHDKVSSHKHLRGGLVFISEIPKTNSGKILRKRLVEKTYL